MPAFGVLYFLTVPSGPWVIVLTVQVLVLGAIALAFVSYVRLGVWVSATSITEQGFFRRTHFQKHEISGLLLVTMFHGGWIDTVPQLFVFDATGTQLVRLRGQFWSRESMLAVAEALQLPLTETSEPLSTSELHAKYPRSLYWFERHPTLTAATFAGALTVAGGPCTRSCFSLE